MRNPTLDALRGTTLLVDAEGHTVEPREHSWRHATGLVEDSDRYVQLLMDILSGPMNEDAEIAFEVYVDDE